MCMVGTSTPAQIVTYTYDCNWQSEKIIPSRLLLITYITILNQCNFEKETKNLYLSTLRHKYIERDVVDTLGACPCPGGERRVSYTDKNQDGIL